MEFLMIDRSRESGISKQWSSHTEYLMVEYTEYILSNERVRFDFEAKHTHTHTNWERRKQENEDRKKCKKQNVFNLIRTFFLLFFFFFLSLIKNKFENKMRNTRIKMGNEFAHRSTKRKTEIARTRKLKKPHTESNQTYTRNEQCKQYYISVL